VILFMKMTAAILLAAVLIILPPHISFSRCPIHALKVNVTTTKQLEHQRIYAEVKNNLGKRRVELERIDQNRYQGLLRFVTSGPIFVVELNCNYFPEYIVIFSGDDIFRKVRVNEKELKSYQISEGSEST